MVHYHCRSLCYIICKLKELQKDVKCCERSAKDTNIIVTSLTKQWSRCNEELDI
jgi:hypothetical protein